MKSKKTSKTLIGQRMAPVVKMAILVQLRIEIPTRRPRSPGTKTYSAWPYLLFNAICSNAFKALFV